MNIYKYLNSSLNVDFIGANKRSSKWNLEKSGRAAWGGLVTKSRGRGRRGNWRRRRGGSLRKILPLLWGRSIFFWLRIWGQQKAQATVSIDLSRLLAYSANGFLTSR